MYKELQELMDATMKPLERFRSDRKRMVAAALAEAANELPNDGYYDVLANGIIRDLKYKEILRRSQERWSMRNLVDRISQLPGAEDSSLSDIDGTKTKPCSVTGLTPHYHDNEPV